MVAIPVRSILSTLSLNLSALLAGWRAGGTEAVPKIN